MSKSKRSPLRQDERCTGERIGSSRRYRVSLDRDACIGCLACTRCEAFAVGTDMKVRAVRSEVDDLDRCTEAALACPVGAIVITPIANSGRK